MKKRILTSLCVLALMLCLIALPASAGESLFFLILNDTPLPPSVQTTPIQSSGWIYVPVDAFNNRATGVNFGIYFGFTDNRNKLVFYTLSGKTLTFDLVNNTASTSTGQGIMPGKALYQNGTYYVPAYAMCDYYGLTYSYSSAEYGPVLRIKDENAVLNDSMMLSSARSLLRSWYNAYQGTQTPSPPSPSVPSSTPSNAASRPSSSPASPDNTAQEEPEVTPEPVKTFSMYLGLRSEDAADVTPSLNTLNSIGVSAVVFFPADDLLSRTDAIRQAAGRGHLIGLIPKGDSPAQRLASVRSGSLEIARILRQETWFVLSGEQELAQAGFLCWSPSVTLASSQNAYEAISAVGTERNEAIRVLADAGQDLASAFSQLIQDGDTFLSSRETAY